jgi:hypothetical protein
VLPPTDSLGRFTLRTTRIGETTVAAGEFTQALRQLGV